MSDEILPVSLSDKAKVIEYVRIATIPELVRREYPAEKALQILHRNGVWYAKPDIIDREFVYLSYIAYYANIDPIPQSRENLDIELNSLIKQPEKFTPYGYFLKGNYRILGCFAPNHKIAKYARETEEYFTGGIPLQSRDYQSQNAEYPFYNPPVFNLHKHMSLVCSNFDTHFDRANTETEIAETIANFYFWGMVMGHPFLGGNHRAFDRFIEYAFAKKDMEIYCPLNSTFNIPNHAPFNEIIYRERRRLLENSGLENQKFNIQSWKDLPEWLVYQDKLNSCLLNDMQNNCFKAKEAGQLLLNWG